MLYDNSDQYQIRTECRIRTKDNFSPKYSGNQLNYLIRKQTYELSSTYNLPIPLDEKVERTVTLTNLVQAA